MPLRRRLILLFAAPVAEWTCLCLAALAFALALAAALSTAPGAQAGAIAAHRQGAPTGSAVTP
jgi:hypothetical protein